MSGRGLLVRMHAKQGKSDAVEALLRSALPMIQDEPDTTAWFAVRFGRNDYGAVFVNAEKLYELVEEGTAYLDGDVFVVNLPAGRSRILVKTGDVGGSGFGFYLRFLDADGREVPGLAWGE